MALVIKKPKKPVIYITRHGDNPFDERKISGGNDQPGLTEEGIEQVEDGPAREWEGKGIQNIFTSDATRARQSAEIIGKSIGAKVIVDKRLETQNIGNLAGNPEDEVKPIMKYVNEHHPNIKLGKTGESFNEFKKRFEEGYRELCSKHKGEVNSFVLHGDGEKMLRSDFGRDMDEYKKDGIGHGESLEVTPSHRGWVMKK